MEGMDREAKIICVVGTRPEAIKMAPVILALRKESWVRTLVLATAQHREMLDDTLSVFGIRPDHDLNLMQPDQTLPELTARLMTSLDQALEIHKPALVLAQGDTTTVFITALACFYRRIPFGHVEAGLRSGKMYYPFPEEMNRVLADRLATVHFAPVAANRDNLRKEGVSPRRIHVTGNTVIDALLYTAAQKPPLPLELDPKKRLILVTAHRRENFGGPFLEICRALRAIAEANPGVEILYPVHPNPKVHDVAYRELGGRPGLRLCQPLAYPAFVAAMQRAYLILSDSGGVQEEAPALGKPVLVLRDVTERAEAEEAGLVKLVGPHYPAIMQETQRLLDDDQAYQAMAKGFSPYGDGQAARRITAVLKKIVQDPDNTALS